MASPNDASTVSNHYVSMGGKKDPGESAIKVYQKKQEGEHMRRSDEHDTYREDPSDQNKAYGYAVAMDTLQGSKHSIVVARHSDNDYK